MAWVLYASMSFRYSPSAPHLSMAKRNRRTPEQQIADLRAKIAEIEERKARKQAMKDPALRHVAAAVRAVDKALEAASDAAMKETLAGAREQLAACAAPNGVLVAQAPPKGRGRKSAPADQADPDAVLRYVRNNPGSSAADVAGALDLDTKAVSPALKSLKEDGKARTEGKARGTRYFATA